MSTFSNPASRSSEAADAYVNAVLELVGDSDPMEILRETPLVLRTLLEPIPEEALSVPEAPGKWSLREVLRHLADSEMVWAVRLRMVLAQERPTLHGYDQDAWAHRLRYREVDVEATFREFAAVRAGNLRLLEGLSSEELARVGMHGERGEESVERMISLYAGHDRVHLRQMRRILAAMGREAEPPVGE
jgi:uncharacterized damage-inducible protein DinB